MNDPTVHGIGGDGVTGGGDDRSGILDQRAAFGVEGAEGSQDVALLAGSRAPGDPQLATDGEEGAVTSTVSLVEPVHVQLARSSRPTTA